MSKHALAKAAIAGVICLTGVFDASMSPTSHVFAAQDPGVTDCHTEVVEAVTHRADGSIDPNAHHLYTLRECRLIVVPNITGTWRGWTALSCGYNQAAFGTMTTTTSGAGTFDFYYHSDFGGFGNDYIDRSWGSATVVTAQTGNKFWQYYILVDFYATGGISYYGGHCV